MKMSNGETGEEAGVLLKKITPALIYQQNEITGDPLAQIRSLQFTPEAYRIGPGDLLNIFVLDHPDLQPSTSTSTSTAVAVAVAGSTDGFSPGSGIQVGSDGTIQYPYIGSLNVAGLTEKEARDKLAAALPRFLRNPQIMLNVRSYRSQRIYVEGEVRNPGIVALGDLPLTLPDALSRTGGVTPVGDTSNIVLTRDGNSTVISLPSLVAHHFNPLDIYLKPRDVIRVASKEESKIFVIGEIQKPVALTLRNGRLTLNEAIGEANGVSPVTSNAGQIYVVRTVSSDQEPTVYHLDAKSPAALILAEQFQLKPRDVVFVDPAPLATWNRVLSLILPSAAAITTTGAAVSATGK